MRDSARGSRHERVIVAPEDRLPAVKAVIAGARERLILSLFRCDDFRVLDALSAAVDRGVAVEVIITRRAKGGRKSLKALVAFLESMGASVRAYRDRVIKYHAKYLVADDGPALVASLNFTRKCFSATTDFMVITHDQGVVGGLQRLFDADRKGPDTPAPPGLSERLILGPERARAQLAELLESATRSIRIVDHKVTDPVMLGLLEAKRASGVVVEIVARSGPGGLRPHGKMIIVDEKVASIGSIALSALCLDFRREVGLIVRNPRVVQTLNQRFQLLKTSAARTSPSPSQAAERRS